VLTEQRHGYTLFKKFFEHKKFIGYVAIDEDFLVGALFAHEKI